MLDSISNTHSKRVLSQWRTRALVFVALLAATLAVLVPAAFAQATASISGTVKDQTGAVIPGAKIVLTDEISHATRSTKSSSDGFFIIQAVQPGATYDFEVSKEGFESWKTSGIEVHPHDSLSIDKIRMKPGAVTLSVEVTAQVAGISMATGEHASVITAGDISRLSTVGRDAAELMSIQPGFVMQADAQNRAVDYQTMGFGSGNLPAFGSNGAPPQAGFVNVMSDGASIIDPGDMGGQVANINMDQVQEVKVQTANFGADQAKGPVVINAVGKSGGTEYHGGLYLYMRNAAANSNDWASKDMKLPRPEQRYVYPGFTVGGPVRIPGNNFNQSKHLTFWVGGEYYGQINVNALATAFVPTPAMMSGDFSEATLEAAAGVPTGSFTTNPTYTSPKNPGNYTTDGKTLLTGCPQPYNVGTELANVGAICSTPTGVDQKDVLINNGQLHNFDPAMAALEAFWPKANTTMVPIPKLNQLSNGINYAKNVMATHNGYQIHGRVDQNFSDTLKLYVTGNIEYINDENPLQNVYWNPPGTVPSPSPKMSNAHSEFLTANLTKVLSSTTTNELALSGMLFNEPQQFQDSAKMQDTGSAWAAAGYSGGALKNPETQLPRTGTYETAAIPSLSFGYVPAGGKGEFLNKSDISLSDNFTKAYRTHTLKAGFYGENTHNNGISLGSGYNGSIEFARWGGCQVDIPAGSAFGGFNGAHKPDSTTANNEVANFLMGCPDAGYSQDNADMAANIHFQTFEGYLSDDWKVTSRLTVTLAARFSHLTPWTDRHGLGALVYLPGKIPQGVLEPFTGDVRTWTNFTSHQYDSSIPVAGVPTKAMWTSPRFGVSYDLFGNGKTQLRGGWGAFRSHDSTQAAGPVTAARGQTSEIETGSLGNCTLLHLLNPSVLMPDSQSGESCTFGVANVANPANPEARTMISNVSALNPNDDALPVTYNYNFTIAQELPKKLHAEVAYVGNQASSLTYSRNVNVIPLGAFFRPDPLTGQVNDATNMQNDMPNDYRPYPNFTQIYVQDHSAWANYNALQATLSRNAGAFTFNVNYSWSKALGTSNGYYSNLGGLDPVDLHNDYTQMSYNRNHVINASYSYQEGTKYHGNRVIKAVVNDWEMSGITTWQSGPQLAAFSSVNYGLGGGVSYGTPASGSNPATSISIPINAGYYLGSSDYGLGPKVLCDPSKNRAAGQYANGNCFGLPQPGFQGSWHVPFAAGPAFFKSDLSIYKNIKLSARQDVQFRFSGFNFLNHPLAAFSEGNGTQNVNLTIQNGSGALPATASQAIQNAVISNGSTFAVAAFKSGVRIIEAGVKYNF